MPILARRSESRVGVLEAVEGMPGPPLGVRDNARYAVAHSALIPGDLLLMFTDGLFEAINAEGEIYGEDRLLDAVRRTLGKPVNRLFDDLHLEVALFSAGQGFEDDVCLLGVEFISRSSGRED